MTRTAQDRMRQAWRTPFLRFLMVGGFTFLLPLATAAALREGLGVADQLAFLLSSILAIEANFLLSFTFTWRSERTWRSFRRAFLRFHASKILTVLLGQLLFAGFNFVLGFYVAYFTVVAVMTAVNFLLQRYWIFGSRATDQAK